ncbi:hypothetical protein [Zobellia alginiliquefaciens]|uniref:hypothetical protein n=1 Tax=Zobellia alginiliquefaciens TaxID=3032586 RepID=UPI0023E3EB5B|nr:hypothetical protein [Zobellia alginiliquefaciens]
MKYLFFSVLLVFLSCKGQEKSAGNGEESMDNDRLQLVESDDYSGSDTEEFLVISDIKTLQKFYLTVNKTRKPGLPIPEIDFTKELLVVYCAGKQQDSSRPKVFIENETSENLILGVEKKESEKINTAITTPFSVYKLPLTGKKIILQEQSE